MKTNKFNHFKMYKSGKQWIIGSVTVGIAIVALGTVDNNILHFESTTVYAAKVQQNDDVKAAPEFILNDTKNFSNIKYIDNNNALGIASLFSIFAQNAKLGADVNGNIAVQNLIDANRDFGTRSNNYNTTTNDVSYIQNINDNKTLNDRAFRAENSVAILGESIKIESNSAGQTEINGGRVSTLTKDNTFQDANSNKYIDFDAYFSSLKLKADTYNASSQTENVISEYSDMNKQFIDVSNVDKNQKFIYVDIDYNKLAGPQDITVKGLSAELLGPTVIFNVKNLPSNDAWIQTKINYEYSNGQTVRQNSENHSMPNHVVWNFGSYQNNINISSGRLLGSVLAPEATVNVGVNVDGNIVGANVNVTGGETHRWDVQTPFTQENEPESTPESVPESTPESVPESTPESVPESTPESVPESTPESVPENTPETVPESTPESVPESTPESVPESTPESVPESTPESVPESTPESVPESTPESVPESTPESVPESTPESVPESTPESVPDSTPESVPESTPESTPESVPESTPESVPESTPESVPESTPESVPESTPESVPESTPESVPESTPESVPESTPESVPESTPESIPESTPESVSESASKNTTKSITENRQENGKLPDTNANNTNSSIWLSLLSIIGSIIGVSFKRRKN